MSKVSAPGGKYVLSPSYGKQSVPVFKIIKNGNQHRVLDMVIKIMLEGNVSDSWLSGNNHQIVPTETQKNTCYAMALKHDFDTIEEYSLFLANDMLTRHKHLSKVSLDVISREWSRLVVDGKEHNHAFGSSPDPIKKTCHAEVARGGHIELRSGVRDVKIMKTTKSGFSGYVQDEYTNLEPVGVGSANPNRIMCTFMTAEWTHDMTRHQPRIRYDYALTNSAVLEILIAKFAGPADVGVYSLSLQETVYKMATAVLDNHADIQGIEITTPNVHFYRWDTEQFGLKNDNAVFQSTAPDSAASGRIYTKLTRSTGSGSKL